MTDNVNTVWNLIGAWERYRIGEKQPERYLTLWKDVRNARRRVATEAYPEHLYDMDDEVMAATEHYFLCRAWVGNGVRPAWQMRSIKGVYNLLKQYDLVSRTDPKFPVSPLSEMQVRFQDEGINAGLKDMRNYDIKDPVIGSLEFYF